MNLYMCVYVHLVAKSCLTLGNPMDCSTPGFPILHYLLESAQTHVHWVGDAIQPSHPLSPPSPFAFNPPQHQGLFQWVGSLHWWPKYWSFSFSINPFNENSGLISVRIDWFDLLQFSRSVLSNSLEPQELQHARLPCPLLSPWVCSNSYPLRQWFYPTISPSVTPFSFCLQSFPTSVSFRISHPFASGGQIIRASPSVLLMNIQGWFPLGLTDLISLHSKALSRVFSSTTIWKHQFFGAETSLQFNSHIHI